MGPAYKTAGSNYSSDKAIVLLRDYLKTDNAISLDETSQSVLKILPKNSALSSEIFGFGEDCLEVAEMASYRGSAHLRLTQLFETLEESGYFSTLDSKTGKVYRFQRLKESMRENFFSPNHENAGEYVNYNSFLAHLFEHRILPTNPTYAIWAMRGALEEDLINEGKIIRSAFLLGAAQWILWNGQSLFTNITQSALQGHPSPNSQSWMPGALYQGQAVFALERWQFWKYRFGQVIIEQDVTDECKEVACRAINLMDSFEKIMLL